MSLIGLDASLKTVSDKLEVGLKTVVRKVVLDLHMNISERTPRDTGRLASSWQVTIGSPTTTAPPPGEYAPPAAPDVSAVDGTQPVFIASALPYAEAIEGGHSSQAPAGMVQISVIEMENELANLLVQL